MLRWSGCDNSRFKVSLKILSLHIVHEQQQQQQHNNFKNQSKAPRATTIRLNRVTRNDSCCAISTHDATYRESNRVISIVLHLERKPDAVSMRCIR